MFMGKMTPCICILFLAAVLVLTGCSAGMATPTGQPARVLSANQVIEETPSSRLMIAILYPAKGHGVEMGQPIRLVVQVTDEEGQKVNDATLKAAVTTPDGGSFEIAPLHSGEEGLYRSERWLIPRHQKEGEWSVKVEAAIGKASGKGEASFTVRYSTSEILLDKYGFWLDAPTLRGITPSISFEQGDARNGRLQWGGVIPAQHVLPEAWVDIQWREGRYPLEQGEDVRRFMVDVLGSFGFTPIREIGPFERLRFKRWDAWKVEGRGQYQQTQVEWVVFYAPEVDKTYSIGTTVVLPPGGLDPHAALRQSFDIDPEARAGGIAPQPLPRLLPAPELLEPAIGAQFYGLDQPVILKWLAMKELADDEYYAVGVDFNWGESNPLILYRARTPELTLPRSLFRTPNCRVFNWDVTLMRQAGLDANGQKVEEKVSHTSLYRYFLWTPLVGDVDFMPACPNAQY